MSISTQQAALMGALLASFFAKHEETERLLKRLFELLPNPKASLEDLDPALEEELRKIVASLDTMRAKLNDQWLEALTAFLGGYSPVVAMARETISYMALKRTRDELAAKRRDAVDAGI